MAWEKDENSNKININKNLQVIDKSSNIEDSILVLEKELQNTKQDDYLKLRVVWNQIKELKKLQEKYKSLEERWITEKTKTKLQGLFQDLWNKTNQISPIWEQIHAIEDTIKDEKNQREDTIIWKMDMDVIDIDQIWKVGVKEFYDNHINFKKITNSTIRDFVEKHIKFQRVILDHKFDKIIENEFMTEFYDTLTVNYLDYIQNSKNKDGLELLHKNLGSKIWIILGENQIKKIIELTVVKVLEKWIDIDDVEIDISLMRWVPIKLNLGEMKLKKIFEIDNKKTNLIIEKTNKLSSKSEKEDINDILSLILKLEDYREKIVKKYTFTKELITVQKLKDTLTTKIIHVLNEKILAIKKIISSTSVKNHEDIDILFKNIRDKVNNLKNIKEKLNIDDTKLNLQELEGYVNLQELYKMLWIINISNIKSIKEKITTKIQKSLIIDEDKGFVWQVNRVKFLQELEIFKGELNEKLLYTYLSISWIESIRDRSSISNPEFLAILRNAINQWEIDLETMSDIVKRWYIIAFLKEFNWINKDQIIRNLSSNETKWKEIFSKELWSEIWADNAEKLFMLSFIESNAMPDKKSESWAVWWFQILPSTAESYIDEDKLMVKNAEQKIRDNMKSEWKKARPIKISKDEIINYILNDPEMSAKIASRYLKYLIIKNKEKFWLTKNIDEIILYSLFLYNWRFTERLILDNQVDQKKQNERLDDQGDESEDENKKKDLRAIINEIFESLNSIKIWLLNWELSIDEAIKKVEKIDDNNFNRKISKWGSNFRIVNLKENWEQISKNDIIIWIDKYTKEILNQQFLYPEQINAANKAYEILKQKNESNIKK